MRCHHHILICLLLFWAAGSVNPAKAVADNQIVIGVATSLNTVEGRESLQSAAMAVEEINRQGGVRIQNKAFHLKIADLNLDELDPHIHIPSRLEKLERFIVNEKVHSVVVGPFRSEVLLPGMKIFARHKTILLETIAMSPAMEAEVIRNYDFRYLFRTGLNTSYLADTLIEVMKYLRGNFGFKRVYIITQDVAWARSTTALLIRLYFDRNGWEVVGTDQFSQGKVDFVTSLARAKEVKTEVIVPIFDMPQSTLLITQWRELKVPALLCGTISPATGADAWQKSKGEIAGSINMVLELGNLPSKRYAPATAFYTAYRRRYGREIQSGHGPAPAYEAVYLLAEAFKKAASLDPKNVVLALEKSDRVGCMGRLRFNRGHQIFFGPDPQKEAIVALFQWTPDGRRRIVYPPSIAEGEIHINRDRR